MLCPLDWGVTPKTVNIVKIVFLLIANDNISVHSFHLDSFEALQSGL